MSSKNAPQTTTGSSTTLADILQVVAAKTPPTIVSKTALVYTDSVVSVLGRIPVQAGRAVLCYSRVAIIDIIPPNEDKMAIDINVNVDASFFYKWMTVEDMKKELSFLRDDDRLVPNRVGNLAVIRGLEAGYIGYIDFAAEVFVPIDSLMRINKV